MTLRHQAARSLKWQALDFVKFLTSAENQRTLVKADMAGTPGVSAAADAIAGCAPK